MSDRDLTDADVTAIVEGLRKEMIDSFYQDLGKGLWGAVVKIIITALIGIAAYSAGKWPS